MVTRDGSTFEMEVREEPWGEQYFPAGLSERSTERDLVEGMRERVGRRVEEAPWRTLGVAVGIGMVVGMMVAAGRGADTDG
jgi:hypothetical protein